MTKIFTNWRVERFPSVDDIRKSRFIELIVLSWKTAAEGSLILNLKRFPLAKSYVGGKGRGNFINSTISAFPSEEHNC